MHTHTTHTHTHTSHTTHSIHTDTPHWHTYTTHAHTHTPLTHSHIPLIAHSIHTPLTSKPPSYPKEMKHWIRTKSMVLKSRKGVVRIWLSGYQTQGQSVTCMQDITVCWERSNGKMHSVQSTNIYHIHPTPGTNPLAGNERSLFS